MAKILWNSFITEPVCYHSRSKGDTKEHVTLWAHQECQDAFAG